MITLITETGLREAGANTYVSLADADAYHTTYGNLDWTGVVDDELRKASLVMATQSVELLFGDRYMSELIYGSTQSFLFPRYMFYDLNGRTINSNQIPLALKNAVCEIALLHITGNDIFPQPSSLSMVKSKKIKVGDVDTSIDYFKSIESERFPGFYKIEKILAPILRPTVSGSFRLKA